MNIVLIETSGNQRYIFSTNKLRENVGASELTYQAATKYVRNAIKKITGRDVPENILDEPPIGTDRSGKKTETEVIIATSGKALLLTEDENIAKKIVSEVTKQSLIELPGLTIHGAICEVKDGTNAKTLHDAVGEVHRRLEEIRYLIPSNQQRFQRLPFATQCTYANQ